MSATAVGMNKTDFQAHSAVQAIAKDTMNELLAFVKPGVTEKQIAEKAEGIMRAKGVQEFWYYGVAAFVLVGGRTVLSISGREYVPSDQIVKENDLVTVDLSPSQNGIWGDYARSISLEDGMADFSAKRALLSDGFNAEAQLHRILAEKAKPDMTAHTLWAEMNAVISELGYKNLDFKGNLGHSIERDIKARRYIEQGNQTLLKDFGLFTFEPHIQKPGMQFGFKHENIYRFTPQGLQAL